MKKGKKSRKSSRERSSEPKSKRRTNIEGHMTFSQLQSLSMAEDADTTPIDKFGLVSTAASAAVTEQLDSTSTNASNTASDSDSKPQDNLLEVVSTTDRGLAVFTRRKIKAGTLLLSEKPLISLDKHEEDDWTAIEREFPRLSRPDQKSYLRLFDAQKSRMSPVVSIYYSNCYNCEGFKTNGQGGSAIGMIASRINHSCIPNVQFSYHEQTNEMRFYAIRDIPKGKEVCSNYDKSMFEVAAKRNRKQQMYYGFVCHCEACEPRTEFWAKSDERRKGMYEILRSVQGCEKKFTDAGGAEQGQTEKAELVSEALEALTRLEGLLLKEGLLGVPLANTYRSMAKWAERRGEDSSEELVRWKAKEREVCVIVFGRDAQRTRDIEAKLKELQTKSLVKRAEGTRVL